MVGRIQEFGCPRHAGFGPFVSCGRQRRNRPSSLCCRVSRGDWHQGSAVYTELAKSSQPCQGHEASGECPRGGTADSVLLQTWEAPLVSVGVVAVGAILRRVRGPGGLRGNEAHLCAGQASTWASFEHSVISLVRFRLASGLMPVTQTKQAFHATRNISFVVSTLRFFLGHQRPPGCSLSVGACLVSPPWFLEG